MVMDRLHRRWHCLSGAPCTLRHLRSSTCASLYGCWCVGFHGGAPLITPRLLSKSQQQHQVSACSEDDMIGALGIEDSRHLRTADYEYIHSSSED